jgi:anti-sigma factor RsiW
MTRQPHPREDLTALLDGALPPGRAAEVRDHLAGCAACRAEAKRLGAGLAALAALAPAPELPPFFTARFEARLREERARPRGLGARVRAALERWTPRRRLLALGGAAAAALAVAGLVALHRLDERRMVKDLDLLENYEVASAVDVDSPEDAQIVAQLDELAPAQGARP